MRFAKKLLTSLACSSLLVWQTGSYAAGQDPASNAFAPVPSTANAFAQIPVTTNAFAQAGSQGGYAPITTPGGALVPVDAPMGAGPASAPAMPFDGDPSCGCAPAKPACCQPLVYGSIEALFWWIKHSPVVPLITTNPDPNTIASLAEPGTTILFGGSPIDFGNITGVRGTIGGWCCEKVGIEGSIFGLPRQGRTFTAVSGGVDMPVIAVPINSTVSNIPFGGIPEGETSFNPGNTASVIRVNATTELWGAQALGLACVCRGDNGYLTLMGGFRYLDLRESLTLDQTFFDVQAPGTLSVNDTFQTRNQIYAAAAGLRAGVCCKCVALELSGLVAFGPSRQEYTALGSTTATPGAFGLPAGTTPGGVFALPSNIGTFSKNEFVVVPEGEAKVTVNVCRNVGLFAAYDFLFINSVLRASNQINRNVNPTQNTIFQPTTGVPGPLPEFARTEFWAQGVSAGIEIRY
jgi:hypothetical protein